jgi:hypothetical protein
MVRVVTVETSCRPFGRCNCYSFFSFLLNINDTNISVVTAFYSPQTRFWELLSGSLLAWLSLYRPNTRFELYRLTKLTVFAATLARNRSSLIGVGLIFLGLITFTHPSAFRAHGLSFLSLGPRFLSLRNRKPGLTG